MRWFLLPVFVVSLVLTFGCDSNQSSFSDTLPGLYTLSTGVSPENSGTVHPSGGEFSTGDDIKIEARPAEGYVFEHWDDDLSGNSNPDLLVFNGNKTVTAHFVLKDYDLNIDIIGEGFVNETLLERSLSEGAEGSAYVTVRLTAVADAGWYFDRWEGDLDGDNNPQTITIDADEGKNVTAIFLEGETDPDEDEDVVTFELDEVKLFIDELELDGFRRTRDFETRYFVMYLPLDGSPVEITHEEIPAGLYDEFEIEIKKPDDQNIDVDDPDFRDETGSYSLVVKGIHHGEGFIFRSVGDFNINVEIDPPLEVSQGQNSLIAITVDFESWFKDANDEILNPNDPANTETINDNIEKSFEKFEEEFESGD